jgi:hypothetical protein
MRPTKIIYKDETFFVRLSSHQQQSDQERGDCPQFLTSSTLFGTPLQIRQQCHSCLAPGWGVWFASIQAGRSRCQAPGKWMRFASIPTQGPQLVPGTGLAATGAWHRVGSSLLASGQDLHDLKVPSTMALLVRLATGCRRQVTSDGS